MSLTIRAETSADVAAVRAVVDAAFAGGPEGRLVDLLRARGKAQVSLVAVERGSVVGHILFSPVTIGGAAGTGLAPVCVLPERQKRGIGATLCREGLRACNELGLPWAVVLGDPAYYSRFGFAKASTRGIGNEYNVDEHFMVLELRPGSLAGISGLAKYGPEFREVDV